MRSLFAYLCASVALAASEPPAFFAMDTAARLEPTECAQVLAELGYSADAVEAMRGAKAIMG